MNKKKANARNGKFHKKYFALIKMGFANQSHWANIDEFRSSVLRYIGFVDLTNKVRSLSYQKCEQEELEVVYNKTVTCFIEKLAINQEILSKVMSYE